ncbi:MAG: hypothetical protein ACP5L4_01875 [Thermoplasmata archaeon]
MNEKEKLFIEIRKGNKIEWSTCIEIGNNQLDTLISAISEAIQHIKNFETTGKSEFREGAIKEMTEGWK